MTRQIQEWLAWVAIVFFLCVVLILYNRPYDLAILWSYGVFFAAMAVMLAVYVAIKKLRS